MRKMIKEIKNFKELKDELIRLNSKKVLIFGENSNKENYLLLLSALDLRNLILPEGWKIDAKEGLTNKSLNSIKIAKIPVLILNTELVAGPNIKIDKIMDRGIFYKP